MKQGGVRYYVFLLFAMVLHTYAASQPTSLHFRHLDISNGLSDDHVNAIIQDKEGFLWIGTQSGLNRYDGKHFVVFRHSYSDSSSIADNICLGLCVDSSDNIWIISSFSISCFNRWSGKFTNYFYEDENGKIITSPDFFKGIMIMKNGHVLVSSASKGYFEIDALHHLLVSKHFPKIPASIANSDKFLNPSGIIWYRTDTTIYASNDDGIHFKKVLDQKSLTPEIPIAALGLCGVSGTNYFFSEERGNVPASIVKSDAQTGNVSIVHFSENFFTAFNSYDQNTSWIAFWGSGLVKYNRKQNRQVNYLHYKNDASTISSNLIKTLFTDKDGNLWIGTENGIDFCNPGRDKVFMVNNSVKWFENLDVSVVETMAEDDSGKIWIGLLDYNSGATNGLIRFDPATGIYREFTAKGAGIYGVWKILPEGDHLLLSTQNGLQEFDLTTESLTRKLSHPFPLDVVKFDKGFSILQKDHSGNYWFGFWRKVVLKVDSSGKEAIYFNTHSENVERRLSDDLVYGLAVDGNNNIWVINGNNNVLEFINNKTNDVLHIPVIIKGQPFTDKFQCVIADRHGNIWIGTRGGGLVMYDVNHHQFHLIVTEDGLPDESIKGLCLDDQDRLWVLTATGLVWIDSVEKKVHAIDNNILRFSGLVGDEPLMLTRDGHLYLGSERGFFYFKPTDVLLSKKLSPPFPISFQKMDKEEYIPSSEKELKVFPGEENISVSFVSLEMTHGNEIDYSYRLKGYEEMWQESGNEGIAKFTKLPPGKYELQMRSSFRGMKWDGKYSSISLAVIPAFYQTWWFRSIIFMMVTLSGIWIIYSASTRHLRQKLVLLKQQQQITDLRNRIANDIHDEIGAGLTRISIRSELAKQNKNASQNDFLNVLQNINSQTHELVNSLGEIVWTINPQQDNLDNMLAYFRHYINKFMEGLPLTYSIQFPESVSELIIHPEIKRNLFLILKEALNNSVKHAQAKKIEFVFEVDQLHYQLKVSDDGKGWHEEVIDQFRNGMKGMKVRASLMHANFKVNSILEKGSEIIIEGDFYDPS